MNALIMILWVLAFLGITTVIGTLYVTVAHPNLFVRSVGRGTYPAEPDLSRDL